jgi:serine/threonine-protein kinase
MSGDDKKDVSWLTETEPPPSAIELPKPGMLLGDTYRVLRQIGSGGMGIVLLARDRHLERDVAIKLIRPDYAKSGMARKRFMTEARAMAGVNHENVVRVYAFGEYRGTPYFVMEYIEGQTVEDWLDGFSGGAMPAVDEVLGIVDQVCRGVGAIHEAGVVHGDLKPGNVLLGPAFRAAVADFGLVRLLSRPTDTGAIVGTPAYIAPETALTTDPPTTRSDVFALGVITYELLTGELPFDIQSARDLIKVHESAREPVPVSERRAELPPSFDPVLAAALLQDPDRRTPSAAAFRRALLQARETVNRPTRPLRVIIADDDAEFRSLAAEAVRFAFKGADIECVPDGQAALAAIDRKPADLAVVDLDMPGMNGIELTAALRAGETRDKRIAILVVTAFGGAPDWKLLSGLGADGFLLKPIDPYALVALARRTIAAVDSLPPPPR